MKPGDKILFAFPILLGVVVCAIAGMLFFSTREFEKSYIAAEMRDVMTEAELVSDMIRPMLLAGNVAAAVDYCEKFPERSRRATLVREDGAVVADSVADAAGLDNHATREEIAPALTGTPGVSTRFSSTSNARMIYCAMPIDINGNGHIEYVLRLAIRNDDVDAMISGAKTSTTLALALGVFLTCAIALYILIRVRLPLVRLQESAQSIARGNLNERISIPEKGVVRELATTVSRMKEQLKAQLDRITAERNGREFLFSALSEAVLLFSEDGNALYLNSAARRLFGAHATSGKFDFSRCGSAELVALANRAFSENVPVEAEISLETGNATRTLFAKGGPIFQDGERRLLLAVTDLTNLRRLESFRSDFVANVSHEIKTPLTGILGAVDALESGALEKPKMAEKFLGILSSQAKRLNALVQDVLSLAAIERRQISGGKETLPFRLDAAVENAVNYCRSRAEAANILLEISKNDPTDFEGDSRLIEQAVINLVSNAIKYSGSPRIEVSLEKDGNAAMLTVRDFGIGIPPEHHARIFERFYSADKAHSRSLGGTGLGLAIVKHIARLHGGAESLESVPGEGCVFRIRFPLRGL